VLGSFEDSSESSSQSSPKGEEVGLQVGSFEDSSESSSQSSPKGEDVGLQVSSFRLQVAIMAPTAILARQHFISMQKLLDVYEITSALLV
jgi:hypothetical protein